MDKKKVAGMGLTLVAGLALGVTVLGGAIAGPKDGAPESATPAIQAVSGTATAMEATAVEEGQLPDLNDQNAHVIRGGSGMVTVGSDASITTSESAVPEGAVSDSGTIIQMTTADGKALDPNDPNLHSVPAGSATAVSSADGPASTENEK